jgi:WD40 repeat protein
LHRFGNRQFRHPETIVAAAASPDGKYLATLGNSSLVVWDLKSMRAKLSLSSHWYGGYGYGDRNAALSFLPDSKSLLVSVRPTDRTSININEVAELAQVWDIETGKMKFALKGHWGFVFASWPYKGGKEIALLSGYDEQSTIKYFNASDGKELRSVKAPFPNRALWISANGEVTAGPSPTGQGFLVTEAESGKELYTIQGARHIQAALSHDGKKIAYHDASGKVTIHDVAKRKSC